MSEFINKKRVLKNTLLLYVRMGVMLLVSLYTSRVVLAALGVDDYGIYNVVGGVVTMFSMVTMALGVAVRRFLNVEMAKENGNLQGILQTSVIAMLILTIVILLLMETGGIWFVNYKLVIPPTRLFAANVAFQISIFTFMIRLIAIPFNSLIVAHERMGVYAYIGIVEVFATLAIAFAISATALDRLILYAALLGCISLFISLFYLVYCQKRIIRLTSLRQLDKSKLKEIYSYSSWSLFGSVGGMLSSQGVNMVFNMFFGVAVNAAMGISNHVSNAFGNFIRNFQTAFDPQLTKSYASEGLSGSTFNFACLASRVSLILTIVLGFPLICNIDFILDVWLTTVPKYAAQFCVVALVTMLIDGCAGALYILVYAKGDVKMYQLWLTSIQVLYFGLVLLLCQMGFEPVVAISFNILSYSLMFAARLYILKIKMSFPVMLYMKNVILPLLLPFVVLALIYIGTNILTNIYPIIRLLIHFICACVVIGCFYISKYERKMAYSIIKQKVLNRSSKFNK